MVSTAHIKASRRVVSWCWTTSEIKVFEQPALTVSGNPLEAEDSCWYVNASDAPQENSVWI